MSIQIKSLTIGSPTKDMSMAAPADNFNTIPVANQVYTLYSAPNITTPVPIKKAAIVKSIRLTNLSASTVAISLYFNRPTSNGANRRIRLVSKIFTLAGNSTYLDDSELTMEAGDSIQAQVNDPNVVQYVISGVEQDVT